MDNEGFFDEATSRSQVKAKLVAVYFAAWSDAALRALKARPVDDGRIAYIDLFAGPGEYEDGTISTPLLVLRHAVEHEELADRLVTIFNDTNPDYVASLREAIDELPGIDRLRHRPILSNEEVDDHLVKGLALISDFPMLVFVDPWGFKEITAELLRTLLRGCEAEVLFLFNYNRVNMALGNRERRPHLAALFGRRGLARLEAQLPRLTPDERERAILRQLVATLGSLGAPYALPFRFYAEDGTRTSHFLVYASRSRRGHGLMRRIMAAESSASSAFEYASPTRTWGAPWRWGSSEGTLVPFVLEDGVSRRGRRLAERRSSVAVDDSKPASGR